MRNLWSLANSACSLSFGVTPTRIRIRIQNNNNHHLEVSRVRTCEKTVVIWTHPGHLTSMKKLLGLWTKRLSLCLRASDSSEGCRRSCSNYVAGGWSSRAASERPGDKGGERGGLFPRATMCGCVVDRAVVDHHVVGRGGVRCALLRAPASRRERASATIAYADHDAACAVR